MFKIQWFLNQNIERATPGYNGVFRNQLYFVVKPGGPPIDNTQRLLAINKTNKPNRVPRR